MVSRIQEVDISGLTVHPACVVSVLLTSLRTESWRVHNSQLTPAPAQSVIINISGKVLMIQRDQRADSENSNGKLVSFSLFRILFGPVLMELHFDLTDSRGWN